MSTSRSSKIEQLSKTLRKHYKPLASVAERSVIEHLVYACVVEESGYELADEAVAKLQQTFVDFNEIRVTTAVELAELFRIGNAGVACAQRLKRILQSVYETRYSFDLEDLKKGNLAKSVEYLSGLKGMTPFVCNYLNQNALGGHAIPLGSAEMEVAIIVGLVTEAEAKKGGVPGLERAVPKSKGLEFAQLIHQLAMDFRKSWKNATVTSVFKDMKVTYKPAPPPPPPPPPTPVKPPAPVAEVPAKPTDKAAEKAAAKGTKAGSKEVVAAASPVQKPTKDTKSSKDAKPVVAAKEQTPAKDAAKKDAAPAAKEAAKTDAKVSKTAKPIKATAAAKKEPPAPPKTSKKSVAPPPKPVKDAKNAKPPKPAAKPATKSKSVAPPSKQKPPTAKKPTPATNSKKPAPKTSSKASQSKTTQALTKKKPR